MKKNCLVTLLSLSSTAAFVPQAPYEYRFLSRVNSQREASNQNGLGGEAAWEKASELSGRIDRIGESFKPKAKQATVLAKAAVERGPIVKQTLKAVGFYLVYFLYKALRGIVAILPPVYAQLYAKFSNVVEYPFEDRIMMRDNDPETGKLRWRTRFNVGILSIVLSASYVAAGATRVVSTFATTARKTRSLLDSVAAAVEKQEENEVKMKRLGDRPIPKPKNYF